MIKEKSQKQKDYEETLELAKSFNNGALKGAGIFALIYGIGGGFSEW